MSDRKRLTRRNFLKATAGTATVGSLAGLSNAETSVNIGIIGTSPMWQRVGFRYHGVWTMFKLQDLWENSNISSEYSANFQPITDNSLDVCCRRDSSSRERINQITKTLNETLHGWRSRYDKMIVLDYHKPDDDYGGFTDSDLDVSVVDTAGITDGDNGDVGEAFGDDERTAISKLAGHELGHNLGAAHIYADYSWHSSTIMWSPQEYGNTNRIANRYSDESAGKIENYISSL